MVRLCSLFWILLFAVEIEHLKGNLIRFCEYHQQHISCSSGVIKIHHADYGRHQVRACGTVSRVTTCSEPGSTAILRGKCEGKRSCNVFAHNTVFGNPCPGTMKYLSLNYSCEKHLKGDFICEHQNQDISCTSGVIKIHKADYGRHQTNVCGSVSKVTTCSEPGSTAILRGKCEGKGSCNVFADNTVFGDPCPGTVKYLSLNYSCESRTSQTNNGHVVKDPCLPGNHDILKDLKRSTLYTIKSTDPYLCDDNLKPGWYVFEGFKDMPTSCVQQYHCGTHAPIWMNGAYPSVHDGIVQREACINYGVPANPTKCCNNKIDIRVKNCGGYMVYDLKSTPSCAEAYCAGSERVCEVGKATVNGTCPDLYPKLLNFPKLEKPEVVQNIVRFPCKIPYKTGIPDVGFEVTWTVDNQPLKDPTSGKLINTTLTGDSRTAYLDASKLQGNLGKDVRCMVSSFHPSSPQSKSKLVPSNAYWAGIRVSTSAIEVDESGADKELTLESTLPIICNAINQNECKLSVELHQNLDPTDTSWTSCAVDLKPDPVTHIYKGTVKVKATRDFINEHYDKVHQISFDPITDFFHPTFVGYKVTPVTITTKNRNHGFCIAHGDPHFQGFDYKRTYNIYKTGDLVLYRSKNQKRPFEIQVRTWGCGRYHPCICAVIAREGNDIIEIDMCEKRMNKVAAPTMKVLSGHPLEGTTIWRDRSGKNFYINFASGARIAIQAYVLRPRGTHERDGMLNVAVQAPTDDLKSAEGLCGNWDGKASTQFQGKNGHIYNSHQTSQFANTWLLAHKESLFYNLPKYESSLKPDHEYCACKKSTVDCHKGNGANNPSKNVCSGGKCIKPKLHTASYTVHKGRSLHRRDSPTFHLLNMPIRNASYPTPSGLTEAKAREMCYNSIMKASLYQRCNSVPSMINRTSSFVDACVEDMKYADGDLFTITHLDAFDSACQNEVMKDVKNIKYGADGEPIPPADVTSDTCPNQCSLNGNCVAGNCVCHAGYTSVDCSIELGQGIILDYIRGEGICDKRGGVCDAINLIADNIIDIDALGCKITPLHNETQDSRSSVVSRHVKAEFVSFMEVSCPLPTDLLKQGAIYQEFNVSMTVDGMTYSSELPYVVYDSHCLACENADHCRNEMNSTCIIDGRCYRRGEQKSPGLVCDPKHSNQDWTPVQEVKEIDYYTASFSGCACPYDETRFTCACCMNDGCQCGKTQPNQCSPCDQIQLCGKYPHLFPASM